MDGGIPTYWGLRNAKKSILDVFNSYEDKIFSWFSMAGSLENLIAITNDQVNLGRFYNLHSPSPHYILAFLLSRNGQHSEAIECLDLLNDSWFNGKPAFREKLRAML